MREIARKNGANTITEEELRDRQYGCVILKLVLHYVDDLNGFIREIGNHVESQGSVVISIPNPHRTAAQYNKPYDSIFIYSNELGNLGLNCTMVHRPFGQIISAFRENGLLLTQLDEVVDRARSDLLPKRLNARFDKVK